MGTLPIKKLICLYLLLFTFVSCQSQPYISGKIEGSEAKGKKIYLISPSTLQEVAASYFGRLIDSAIVDAEGNFEFHNLPKTNEAIFLEVAVHQSGKHPMYLQTDDPTTSNYIPILWQPGESIRIIASADEIQKSFSIENPSIINKELLTLLDINIRAYQTYLAGKHWDVEEGSQLLDKEHAKLQYQTELMKFADSTRFLVPAMVALRWVSPEGDYERVPEFLVNQCNKWLTIYPDHQWVKQLCKQTNPSELPLLKGDLFPNFSFPLTTGETRYLSEILGSKLTIIDLWASWCAPCRKENREVLVPIWNEFHEQGLQIIGYSLESELSVLKAAAERDGANKWYQASDLRGDDAPLLKILRIQTIPANFILDDKGMVVAKNLHGNELIEFVKNYIK